MPYKITIEADTPQEVSEAASAIAEAIDGGSELEEGDFDNPDAIISTDTMLDATERTLHGLYRSSHALVDLIERIRPLMLPMSMVEALNHILIPLERPTCEEGTTASEAVLLRLAHRSEKLADAIRAVVAGLPDKITRVSDVGSPDRAS